MIFSVARIKDKEMKEQHNKGTTIYSAECKTVRCFTCSREGCNLNCKVLICFHRVKIKRFTFTVKELRCSNGPIKKNCAVNIEVRTEGCAQLYEASYHIELNQ